MLVVSKNFVHSTNLGKTFNHKNARVQATQYALVLLNFAETQFSENNLIKK